MSGRTFVGIAIPLVLQAAGCFHQHPEITAVALSPQNQCEPAGIPFYLPKPLLIVAKNFRNIEEAKVGLTDSAPIPGAFDDQAKYADLNARTNFVQTPGGASPPGNDPSEAPPGGDGNATASPPRIHSADGAPLTPGEAPRDGLSPSTFYTYQIVFVPDLTQKYGLRIKGGAGEIRAAMNLVNGWQFTGLGPYYMKDSSSAQNVLAHGVAANLAASGVADVVNSLADLAGELQTGESATPQSPNVKRVVQTMGAMDLNCTPMTIPNFAEIHVYEPYLTPNQMMEWREIVCMNFNRDYLGTEKVNVVMAPAVKPAAAKSGLQTGEVQPDAELARMAVAHVFGVPPDSPALRANGEGLQSGELVPGGGVNQVQIDCGPCQAGRGPHEFNLFKFGDHKGLFHHHQPDPPTIETRAVFGSGVVIPPQPAPNPAPVQPKGGGGLQTDEVSGSAPITLENPILNQPTLNQPTFNQPLPGPGGGLN